MNEVGSVRLETDRSVKIRRLRWGDRIKLGRAVEACWGEIENLAPGSKLSAAALQWPEVASALVAAVTELRPEQIDALAAADVLRIVRAYLESDDFRAIVDEAKNLLGSAASAMAPAAEPATGSGCRK